MNCDEQAQAAQQGRHPRPAATPAFLIPVPADERGAAQQAPQPSGPSFLARAATLLRARLGGGESEAQPDDEGRYLLPARSKVCALPRLDGAPRGMGYCLVAQGIALPPGGAAWLVSFDDGDDPTAQGRAVRGVPGVVSSRREAHLRVEALVDEFGRAFACDCASAMSPARMPDVQLKRYADQPGRGCVDVAQEKGRTLRVCEFEEGPRGISLVNPRVDVGGEARDLSLAAVAAVSFLAFWLFPHKGGCPLSGVGVRDALAKMRGSDVFEAAQALIDVAGEAEGRPNVLVPGLAAYAAQALREAGLDGADPANLGQAEGPEALAQAGVPFLSGALVLPAGDASQAGQVVQRIAAMIGGALAASGIPGLTVLGGLPAEPGRPQAPQVKLVRTTKYANSFYVAFDPGEVSAEGARMLLEAEGLFNRLLLVQQAYGVDTLQSLGRADAADLDLWCVDHAFGAARPFIDRDACKVEPAEGGACELDVRLAFARGCECLRLPYRLEYEFDYDPDSRTLGVEVGGMPACVMPCVRWDEAAQDWAPLDDEAREGLASRYAAFSLMAVAAVGFWSCPDVEAVWVNVRLGWGATRRLCQGRGADEPSLIIPGLGGISLPSEPDCVLSAQLDRARFEELLADADARDRLQADPFEALSGVPHVFGFDAGLRLTGVRPLFGLDRPPFPKQGASCEVELDDRELATCEGAPLAARRVCDLGIFEGVERKEEARRIMESYEGGDGLAAIAQARDACARTENPLVRAALTRLIEGIACDSITPDSHDEADAILEDVYGLQAKMELASQAVGKNPAQARRILEGMVDDADVNGWFADSATRCFRYFDSYAARALYAWRCADDLGGRDLALVADEYYMAHYRLSTLLGDDVNSCEEAIQHARRCAELAPGVAASHLRLARCYFAAFDYASQIEALKAALRVIWNPKDLGLALYWLGYALCMTGQTDAGMACYQRCVAYDRSLAQTASSEMADIAKREGLEVKAFTEREARLAMQAAGIDLGLFEENTEFLVRAAGEVLAAGNRGLAFKLLGAAGLSMHDDAVAPVLSSLEE